MERKVVCFKLNSLYLLKKKKIDNIEMNYIFPCENTNEMLNYYRYLALTLTVYKEVLVKLMKYWSLVLNYYFASTVAVCHWEMNHFCAFLPT